MYQAKVLQDVRTMSNEELTETYGIEIDEKGSVWDSCEMKQFEDLDEWAAYIAAQEEEGNYGSFEKIGGRQHFDDEY